MAPTLRAMQILSAADAVSPALTRTRLVLFKPFRWGRSWKLAATGHLSIGGMVFLPFPLFFWLMPPMVQSRPSLLLIVLAVSVGLTALLGVLFYLCSRVQFAFFDIVLHRGEFVAPAWRKYGLVSWSWTLWKAGIGCAVTLQAGVFAFPVFRSFSAAMTTMPPTWGQSQSGQLPPAAMIHVMLAFYSIYFACLFAFGLYYLVMSTASAFMLPSMALESLSPRAAFQRMLAFLRQQPGAFFGFVGLRAALGIAGYMGVVLAYEIVLLLLAAICGLVGWLGYIVLHAMHVPSPVLLALGGVVLVLFFFGINGYLTLLCVGTFFTFFEAHTLYFLGGRYPLLGDLLDASTPPPPYVPPLPMFASPGPYPSGQGWPPPQL